jgi:hypothetical protein
MRLRELDVNFDMIDRNNGIMMGSSSHNQCRLHKGFHYCRSHTTRVECREGFDTFMKRFPYFSEAIPNMYIISKYSLIDAKTYEAVYMHERIPFETVTLKSIEDTHNVVLNPENIDGSYAFECAERWINFIKVSQHFENELKTKLLFYDSKKISIDKKSSVLSYNKHKYDVVFDCTYGQLFRQHCCFYEVCITLIYKLRDPQYGKIALTVMDGQFFSIYPHVISEDLFSLTHVRYTPIITTKNIDEAREFAQFVKSDPDFIPDRQIKIEEDVKKTITNFTSLYKYHSNYISIKSKFDDNMTDDRSIRITNQGNMWSFCGGKITGVFALDDVISKVMYDSNII